MRGIPGPRPQQGVTEQCMTSAARAGEGAPYPSGTSASWGACGWRGRAPEHRWDGGSEQCPAWPPHGGATRRGSPDLGARPAKAGTAQPKPLTFGLRCVQFEASGLWGCSEALPRQWVTDTPVPGGRLLEDGLRRTWLT